MAFTKTKFVAAVHDSFLVRRKAAESLEYCG